ncbi:MAG TPA: phosphoribosyltransferase family protein [Solirubrobacterales bacterium]|nr:phosphoribosyltransferase family protein [Solirubrobacterales bacterium]
MADRLALFADRDEAGRRLAAALERFRERDPIVVALPRGGVPVAFEIARLLQAPLDILLVRKLGAPARPEYGIGAIAEGGFRFLRHEEVELTGVSAAELEAVVADESAELERRRRVYRGDREPLDVEGRTVLLVDDGVATGGTVKVAAQALRARGAAEVVLAVPVGPPGVGHRLARDFDQVICLEEPHGFFAVGQFYVDFSPVPDEEVTRLLELGREVPPMRVAADAVPDPVAGARTVEIEPEPGVLLEGDLQIPVDARGLVLFAHGAGSSRRSPRNRQVAERLNRDGFATLLFDLLTEGEAAERANVFDIGLLTQRLLSVTRWAQDDEELRTLPIFYFGASTGAAAALRAAAHVGSDIHAVVSRGGRPDLAGESLERVVSPTLLIVGGADWQVLGLNEEAAKLLPCRHQVAIVPGATHLFEEPGALDLVAQLAAEWFSRFLTVAA